MYDYFVQNPMMAVILIALLLIFAILLAVKVIRDAGLEKIRCVVYKGFLVAEHSFQHGDNEQKFDYVVQLARSALPSPLDLFITEKSLRKVIQLWFDLCKDLLDDGKINNTHK